VVGVVVPVPSGKQAGYQALLSDGHHIVAHQKPCDLPGRWRLIGRSRGCADAVRLWLSLAPLPGPVAHSAGAAGEAKCDQFAP